MTIVIYFNEAKTCYQVIRPKTSSKEPSENFDGNVLKLVEHITKSDFQHNVRNYHSFEIIN